MYLLSIIHIHGHAWLPCDEVPSSPHSPQKGILHIVVATYQYVEAMASFLPGSESGSLTTPETWASLLTRHTSTRSARRGALHDARFRSLIRSAAAESWKLCSRASDLHRASVVHLRREVGAIRRDLVRGDRCVRTDRSRDRWARVAWSRLCCIHRDCNWGGGFPGI